MRYPVPELHTEPGAIHDVGTYAGSCSTWVTPPKLMGKTESLKKGIKSKTFRGM